MDLARKRIKNLARDFVENSSLFSQAAAWVFLIGFFTILMSLLPDEVFIPGSSAFIISFGIIGLWRWSWMALHYCRAMWYRKVTFPRIRENADLENKRPDYIHVLCTSYRMDANINALCYGSIINEIERYGVPATIHAAITDPADLDLLRTMVRKYDPQTPIRIFARYQSGKGKRDAMAMALRDIAEDNPGENDVVILMDGDSVLGEGALEKTCSVLASQPELGAVTTANTPHVKGSAVWREWYRLRMAQRDNLMCSMSHSEMVLVLTGRFSAFRGSIAGQTEFAAIVEKDWIRHWRLGRIKMLTGDDKSTWFHVLSRGWKMIYLPDVDIHCLEEPPVGSFPAQSMSLMRRWFGNMIRNSSRAIALGPKRIGFFPWIALLDQRISMWTTLIGPVFFTLASFIGDIRLFCVYMFWILLTRTFYTFMLGFATGKIHPLFIPLLWYTQIVGSILKIIVNFAPHKQKWTRQATGKTEDRSLTDDFSSIIATISIIAFMLFIAWLGDVSSVKDRAILDPTTFGTGVTFSERY